MGLPVHRLGDLCSGHGCFGSRPNAGASGTVLINGLGVHRVGDPWQAHCCPHHGCHGAVQETGSGTVFANGLPIARIGDSVSCGSRNQTGSADVLAG